MLTGLLFDLREFTVHDGPGIRTTVFLKGCPLRCAWCHNPEGRSRRPQVMRTSVSSRVVGQEYTSAELAWRLNAQAEILRLNEGGVTFSGGEPLLQAAFVAEVIDQLGGLHVLLDTSGYGSRKAFLSLARRAGLVYFDLKLMDPALFRHYAGRDNGPILRNLRLLSETGVPYVIRVPLVPGVTDSRANLSQMAAFLRGLPGLVQVDLLPYNRLAGAKYAALGMEFAPGYDEDRPLAPAGDIFEEAGLPWRLA